MSKLFGLAVGTGLTNVGAVRFNESGQVYNVSLTAYETYTAGNVDNYLISMSEYGTSGSYSADDPTPTVRGFALIVLQSGGSLTQADLEDAVGSCTAGPIEADLSTQAKADVNTEADTALADYDGPTNTEMEARTLPSADYFDPSADSVTVETNNDKTGYALTQPFPTNFDALGINSSGHISRVVLVDTTTTNSDMRGTDLALLADDYVVPPTVAEIDTELSDNHGNGSWETADIGALPTLTQLEERTLLAADYFDPLNDTVANVTTVAELGSTALTQVQSEVEDGLLAYGTSTLTGTDVADAIGLPSQDLGTRLDEVENNLEIVTGSDGATLATNQPHYDVPNLVRDEMDTNSTKLADILTDTNEIVSDWEDGGRLDLILDSIAASDQFLILSATINAGNTGWITVDNPTAELATAGYLDNTLLKITDVSTGLVQYRWVRSHFLSGGDAGFNPDVDFGFAPVSGDTISIYGLARWNTNVSHAAGTAWNSGSITANTVASNTITSAKVATGAFTSAKFDSDFFASIWSYASRSLTTYGTLVADVWSYATRTLTAFSFTPTPSNAADTTAIKAKTDRLQFNGDDEVLAATDAVISADVRVDEFTSNAMSQLRGVTAIYVTSPVAEDGSLSLIQGDDYFNVDSRALEWINEAGTWPDLTAATVTLRLKRENGTPNSVAGTVITPTGANQKIRVELTSAFTAQLEACAHWTFEVEATLSNGHDVTLVIGDASVTEQIG